MNEKKYCLSGEYKRFQKSTRHLRRLHKDTFQAIDNVIESENLTSDQVGSLSASPSEVTELHHRLHAPISIIITGQDNYGKVAILTKLLGVRILPFSGLQHTCDTAAAAAASSFDRTTSYTTECSTSTLQTNINDPATVNSSKESAYIANTTFNDELTSSGVTGSVPTLSSTFSHQQDIYEKPWRGIRIAYSASQVRYSVVRPGSHASYCQCENGSNDNTHRKKTLKSGRVKTILEPEDVSLTLESRNSNIVSSTFNPNTIPANSSINTSNAQDESHQITSRSDNIPVTSNEIYIGGLPVSADDITVAQLEELLDSKLQTHLAEQKSVATASQDSRNTEAGIQEVPLSELELGTRHLQDPILRDAILDIGLNHCLLREHVHIIVTPTINKYKEQPEQESVCTTPTHDHDTLQLENSNTQTTGDDQDTLSSASEVSCGSAVGELDVPEAEVTTHYSTATDNLRQATATISIPKLSEFASTVHNHIDIPGSSFQSKSPSLKFGTALSFSALGAAAELYTFGASSASTSLDSSYSFKSLALENFQASDKAKISCLTKSTSYSRSLSYSLAQESLENVSGVLLSNVPRGSRSYLDRYHSSGEIDRLGRRQSKKSLVRSPSLKEYDEICSTRNSMNRLDVFHSPDITLSASAPSASRRGSVDASCEEMLKRNKCKSTGDLLADDEDDDIVGFSSSDLPVQLSPSTLNNQSKGFMGTLLPNVTPIVLYAITRDYLAPQDLCELQELTDHSPDCPVMFIRVPPLLPALNAQPHDKQHELLAELGILPHPPAPVATKTSATVVTTVTSSIAATASVVSGSVTATTMSGVTAAISAVVNPISSTPDPHKSVVPANGQTIQEFSDVTANTTRENALVDCAVQENLGNFDPGNVEEWNNADGVYEAIDMDGIGSPDTNVADPLTASPDAYAGDPIVFHMDHTPKQEFDKRPSPKAKSVTFMKKDISENKSMSRQVSIGKGSDVKPKKDKEVMTAGNCTDAYTDKQKRAIVRKNAQIYQLFHQASLSTINISRNMDISINNEDDEKQSTATDLVDKSGCSKNTNQINSDTVELSDSNWCKIPPTIMRALTDDFGFFKTDSKPLYVKHCHIFCEDLDYKKQTANPFVNAFNRKTISSAELHFPAGNNDGTGNIVMKDEEQAAAQHGSTTLTSDAHNECTELCVRCDTMDTLAEFDRLRGWAKLLLRGHLAYTSQLLSKVQGRCLSSFVVFSFELSRRMQITPRRLLYARQQEETLYSSLLSAARHRDEHIRLLITRTLDHDRDQLLSKAQNFTLQDVYSNTWTEAALQERVLKEINTTVGEQLLSGVQGLRDNCLGTLSRCLAQLEDDCCQGGEQFGVSHALKKLVNAAYQVEVRPTSSWGLLRGVWERVKALLGGGVAVGNSGVGGAAATGSVEWKRQVASDMIDSLSEKRLARTISAQVCGEIKAAHSMFLSNLELLEQQLSNGLLNTEQQHRQLKSVHAPKLAKLALHTDALNNRIHYGLPVLCGELGRGHFGVVYKCQRWGRFSPCAVKTLLPRDTTQWRDISLQYHYTRLMGHHERIVNIHACLIDKHYGQSIRTIASRDGVGGEGATGGGGVSNQCVLLIMDVLKYDLDAAIRRGLQWFQRFRIAIDVVQGIRFLHSQGLVHRDIKPKNVLIDGDGRAKITDLDFCKPEAMMTGSVVGTPIHMAPELFTGNYDNSVDVYAFGVLFWYLCSGKTNMPRNYCLQKSKEDLKHAVFNGVRPECLSTFSPECWTLMEQCWSPEPRQRMLLGTVEQRLEAMLDKCLSDMEQQGSSSYHNAESSVAGDDDSDNDSYSSASDDSALAE